MSFVQIEFWDDVSPVATGVIMKLEVRPLCP